MIKLKNVIYCKQINLKKSRIIIAMMESSVFFLQ